MDRDDTSPPMAPGPERRFSLAELAALSDTPPRTVRFWIQEGLIDRPEGVRRGAWYTHTHLEQLLSVRRWQAAGLSLERIRELVHRRGGEDDALPPPRRPGDIEVLSHVVLAEGLELVIEPGRAGLTPGQLYRLAAACVQAAARIRAGQE